MAKKKLTVSQIDKKVPELAQRATNAAYRRALKNGNTVVVAREGKLSRVHPDGRVEVIKKIPADVKVKKGTVIHINE